MTTATEGYPSGQPPAEPGHIGRAMSSCPQCKKRVGWQRVSGMLYAAQLIRHEAVTEEELDLAEVCEFTAQTHYRLPNGMCPCGDKWDPEIPGPVPGCQAFLDVAIQRNFWVMRKVWRMRAKWAGVTRNVHAR